MVYSDGIHIVGDSIAELHKFCFSIGIKRCWFDPNIKHPHYDCPKYLRHKLLSDQNITIVNSREIVRLSNINKNK